MEWEKIVEDLKKLHAGYPEAAMRALLDDPLHREPLLQAFEQMSQDVAEMESSVFVILAMNVLAYHRETRALPAMLRIAALPSDSLERVLGDALTECLASCVAAVGTEAEPLIRFIENPEHDEWARFVLLDALVIRVFEGDQEAAPILAWAKQYGETLAQGLGDFYANAGLASDLPVEMKGNELVLQGLADMLADLGSEDELSLLRRWSEDGCLDPLHAGIDFYERELGKTFAQRRAYKLEKQQGYVRDIGARMRAWACFETPDMRKQREARYRSFPAPLSPIVNGPKIGRNDPCPCGSGKKYKKCCAAS